MQSCTHMVNLCKVSLMDHAQAYCRLSKAGRLHLNSTFRLGRLTNIASVNLQAMRKFARLRRPVYITETGIADKSDNLRAEWAESYFKAVSMDANSFFCLSPYLADGIVLQLRNIVMQLRCNHPLQP